MTKLSKGTWVVVADSARALLLRTVAEYPAPVFEVVAAETPDVTAADLRPTDRSGRLEKTGGRRSAMEEPGWRAMARDLFAEELSALLARHVQAGDFDRLVLVAPPRVLGALRDALPRDVAACVVAEIGKDLTGQPVRKLEAAIAAELAGA